MRHGKFGFALCAGVFAVIAGVTGVATPAHARPVAAPPSVQTGTVTVAGDARAASDAPAVYGRAAYLVDATTGDVLLDGNAGRRMPVASLTKVMTAYIVLREADLTDKIEITREDVRYGQDYGATKAWLRQGDRVSVRDLLYALMLASGADAAHALARTYGPGVENFTAKMNATARELGMPDTTYLNADGLPTPHGQGGVSTARDQARLAEIALRDPRLVEITSARRHHVPRTAENRSYTWTNTNSLTGGRGVIGLKTGYTRAAGYCLTFAADRDGHRLIGVILGERLSGRRFHTARALLDWAQDGLARHEPTEGEAAA